MDEALHTHEAPRPDLQQPDDHEQSVIELTQTVRELLVHSDIDEAKKEQISDALYFLELPLMDPSSYSEISVDTALSLRKLYPVVSKYRELCVQMLDAFCAMQGQRLLTHDDINATVHTLALFISKRSEYESLVRGDVSESATSSVGDLVVSKSEELADMLTLEEEQKTFWDTLLRNVDEDLPRPKGEIDSSNPRENYLHLRYHDISQSRVATLDMFREYIFLLAVSPHAKTTGAERASLITSLFEYAKKKETYLIELEQSHKTSEPLKGAIFSALGEIGEEVAEDSLESFFGPMRAIELTRACATVRTALARAGMTETPAILQVLLRGTTPGAQLLRETLRVVSPQSYPTVLFFSLYLYLSEDKNKALMTYSMLQVTGKFLDLTPAALSSIIAKIPSLARFAPRIAKLKIPMPAKLGILLLAAWGFSENIESTLSAVERNADPETYDFAGNVMGALTAPLDVFPTWGITFGTTDLTKDQLKYLTYEPAIAQSVSGTTLAHRIEWWDDLVSGYAREEKNPIRRKTIELESIRNGPGGIDGWTSRRAFEYYRDLEQIVSIEESLNAYMESLHIGKGPVSLSMRLHDTELDTGDRNVREAITYLEPYDSMYRDIDVALQQVHAELSVQKTPELVQREKDLQDFRKMYQIYEALAKQLDQERSNYLKLGVLSQEWFKNSSGSHQEIGGNLPTIVRQGMFSEMVYQSRRKEAFLALETGTESTLKSARLLAENLDSEAPPSLILDPLGWLQHFAVAGETWDQRIDRATSHDALNYFINRLSICVPREKYSKIFEPLVKTILEQRVQNYDPHAVIGPLASEYADAMFDGELRTGKVLLTLHNVSSKESSLSLPHLHSFGELKNLSDLPVHLYSTEEPVIVCSQNVSPDSSVTAVMEFLYDVQSDCWNVRMTSVGSMKFSAGGLTEPISTRVENGTHTKTETFSTWRLQHPQFASQIISSMNQYRGKQIKYVTQRKTEENESVQQELLQQLEAKDVAKKQQGVWIQYPMHHAEITERRHEYIAHIKSAGHDSGYFVFLRTPQVPDGSYITNGDPAAIDAKGSIATTRLEITDEKTGDTFYFDSMHGDYVQSFLKQQSSIPLDVLTRAVALPIPDNSRASVRTVLALYVRDIVEVHNRSIEDALIRLYDSKKSLQEKAEFLHRFEHVCRNQSQHGRRVLSLNDLQSILRVYKTFLMGKYEGAAAELFLQGDEILGVLPDENGIYTFNATKRSDVLPMYFKFNGQSWTWNPGVSPFNPHPDRWYDLHEVNVPWMRENGSIGTSSPVDENMDTLLRLQKLSLAP